MFTVPVQAVLVQGMAPTPAIINHEFLNTYHVLTSTCLGADSISFHYFHAHASSTIGSTWLRTSVLNARV